MQQKVGCFAIRTPQKDPAFCRIRESNSGRCSVVADCDSGRFGVDWINFVQLHTSE
jgi:hypothetical protein